MNFGFSYIGLIWMIMLTVPNLIWTKNQPTDYEKYSSNENKILLAFERCGQVIVTTTALIFTDFNFKGFNFWLPVLAVSFILMVLYELSWIRYFRSEKTMQDYYRSFLGIPVAGATLPVIAFFLLGIYGGNIVMLIGTIILGIGHIGIHKQHEKEVNGPKKKKKLGVRIITGFLKAVCILLAVLIGGSFVFCIAVRNYRQISRAVTYKNGVNEQIYVQLNDQQEYITVSGKNNSNPVIISLHGGPGAPSTFSDYYWHDYLTDDYTVIAWDERGCGRTYYKNEKADPDNKTLTFEQQLSDLDALVDYARNRFGQDKVIIMGHSYGSFLGSRYVLAHPEKVSAYIGIGQVVNEKDYAGEVYSYEDALRIAKEKGDDTSEMEAAYEKFKADMSLNNLLALRKLVEVYHPVTETADASTFPTVTSPIAGVNDLRWFILELKTAFAGDTRFEQLQKPLDDRIMSFNGFETDDQYQMPVLFISGSCDWTCPVGLMQEYAEQIKAPRVKVSLIEGCGHSPMGQRPVQFTNEIKAFLKG